MVLVRVVVKTVRIVVVTAFSAKGGDIAGTGLMGNGGSGEGDIAMVVLR